VDKHVIGPHIGVAGNVMRYAAKLTKCHQQTISALVTGKPADTFTCQGAAIGQYLRTAAKISPPACVNQDALAVSATAAVQRFDPIVWCNRQGSLGALSPEEFGGGWVPALVPWKSERGASAVLVKYGQAVGKCITRALTDVSAGRPSRADECVIATRDKAARAATKYDFSLPGFRSGTGCYEAPNDIAGILDGVERLAGDLVPQILCFE
jgi:hypothetical protein